MEIFNKIIETVEQAFNTFHMSELVVPLMVTLGTLFVFKVKESIKTKNALKLKNQDFSDKSKQDEKSRIASLEDQEREHGYQISKGMYEKILEERIGILHSIGKIISDDKLNIQVTEYDVFYQGDLGYDKNDEANIEKAIVEYTNRKIDLFKKISTLIRMNPIYISSSIYNSYLEVEKLYHAYLYDVELINAQPLAIDNEIEAEMIHSGKVDKEIFDKSTKFNDSINNLLKDIEREFEKIRSKVGHYSK